MASSSQVDRWRRVRYSWRAGLFLTATKRTMADFAFNNGSFGLAFEPLRDEGSSYGGFGGVELRGARAFSNPVAGAPAPSPAASPGSTAGLRSRPTAAPPRRADRTSPLVTCMPAPSARRLNQIAQHVAAQTPAGHPRGLARTTQRLCHPVQSASGTAPAELGGELPTENYVLED
jgi:hypothetical protein